MEALRGVRVRCSGSLYRGSIEGPGGITSVAVSLDGRIAFTGHAGYVVALWDVPAQRHMSMIDTPLGSVECVALSPDGKLAMSGAFETEYSSIHGEMGTPYTISRGGRIRVWSVADERCVLRLDGHTDQVTALAMTVDGRIGVSASSDATIRFWDLATGTNLETYEGSKAYKLVAISDDGLCAIAVESGGYDVEAFACSLYAGELEGHTDEVTSIALTTNGAYALSGAADTTLRLWDIETGQCVRVFVGHTARISSLAISADDRFALSASDDLTLRLWELETGRCLTVLQGPGQKAVCVALSGDCRWALAGCGKDGLHLWKMDWEYKYPELEDWHEGARPYIDTFLTCKCSIGADGYWRDGKPSWTDFDVEKLMNELEIRGYGWLRADGIRRKLLELATNWDHQPPPPGVARAVRLFNKAMNRPEGASGT